MNMPALERTSAAKAGWVIIALTVGWSVFLLLPDPPNAPAPEPGKMPVPATSLTRSGLREYTDWEGLPEIFAIWADQAEWKDNRTRFAYWHPVMKDYSYFFEATRVDGRYRFREIAQPREPDHHWDESLGADCPIRFYRFEPDDKSLERATRSDPVGVPLDELKPKREKPVVKIPTFGPQLPAATARPKP